VRDLLEKAIDERLLEHQEAHRASIQAHQHSRKNKKSDRAHPCEDKPCVVCRGEGLPCGCGAPAENATPCHACGGKGTFSGASLVCDTCGGAPTRLGAQPCEACQGKGSKAPEAVYTEGGVMYPFQIRDAFRHESGLRVSGTVELPGQPTFRKRTRPNLPFTDTPTEGHVSPPGELKKEEAPTSEPTGKEPKAPASEDATIAEPLSERDTSPETFLGVPLEAHKPHRGKRRKSD
jgi:hypothetical protein